MGSSSSVEYIFVKEEKISNAFSLLIGIDQAETKEGRNEGRPSFLASYFSHHINPAMTQDTALLLTFLILGTASCCFVGCQIELLRLSAEVVNAWGAAECQSEGRCQFGNLV